MVSIPSAGQISCIIETPQGLILRVPVLRIDATEALCDTAFAIPPRDGFEVIFERPDGRAEVLHTEVRSSGAGGLLLRWDFRHPSEMSALDRLLEPSTRAPVLGGRDVPLDLEQALRIRTRLVRTSKIAAQRDSVRVLKLDTVRELIETAVDEALERSADRLGIDDEERERILGESESRFQELLAREKAEKQGIEERSQRLEERLERARLQLEREKERERLIDEARLTLSDEGIDEIERRIGDRLDRAIDRGHVEPGLEAELRAIVAGVLDIERARIRELAALAHGERVDLLEQKVQRLARTLAEAERERDAARQRAHALEMAGGALAVNIYQPGIDGEDPNAPRKLALLADLVRENHELRARMEEQGRGAPRVRGTLAVGPESA